MKFHTSLRDYRLFFPVSQEFLLGYSQTVPTGLTCPSHDPMRGVSSSVMHKVHRTKMYKLQGTDTSAPWSFYIFRSVE